MLICLKDLFSGGPIAVQTLIDRLLLKV